VAVVVVDPGAGDVAAFEVEAWTSKRLSLFVEGPVGSVGVDDLVLTSVIGATPGLEPGAGADELVCAVATVRATREAAPAQRKIVRRLDIG
jgi:hypothetical protein